MANSRFMNRYLHQVNISRWLAHNWDKTVKNGRQITWPWPIRLWTWCHIAVPFQVKLSLKILCKNFFSHSRLNWPVLISLVNQILPYQYFKQFLIRVFRRWCLNRTKVDWTSIPQGIDLQPSWPMACHWFKAIPSKLVWLTLAELSLTLTQLTCKSGYLVQYLILCEPKGQT